MEEQNSIRLSELKQGEQGIIMSQDDNDFAITLMEMGCVPGEPVGVEMLAPLGDPMAIKVAGYFLSIRKKDAKQIWVRLS